MNSGVLGRNFVGESLFGYRSSLNLACGTGIDLAQAGLSVILRHVKVSE